MSRSTDKKIIFYSDTYGYFSKKAKKWFVDHQFKFEERDVGVRKISDELFKVSGQYAVPVIVIGKKIILGFNEEELQRILRMED